MFSVHCWWLSGCAGFLQNRYRESIPENLLRVMSPEDFGIHSNLDADSRVGF